MNDLTENQLTKFRGVIGQDARLRLRKKPIQKSASVQEGGIVQSHPALNMPLQIQIDVER